MSDPRAQAEAERHVPYDIEVEQALLGICLVDNTAIDRAAEMLNDSDFYDPLHGRLFEMFAYLQTLGEVTPLLVNSAMRSDPGLVEMGGAGYLAGLALAAPALPNVRGYATIVRDLSRRRALIKAGEEMIGAAYETPMENPTAEICDAFQAKVDEIASASRGAKGRHAVVAADAAADMLRRIEEQATAERPHGVSTGQMWLDKIVGGLFPGKLLVAAGRPGMGKSILGTNIARAAAARLLESGATIGIPVDYLSGEMDNDELSARIGCEIDFDTCAEQRMQPLKYGDFTQMKAAPGDFERLVLANGKMRELDLSFFDVSGMTLEWIEATCRRRSREKPGHRLVIIDHLQLVDLADPRRGANRNEIQTVITKRLKSLAKELGITILLLCQLSRDVEKRDDKHPQLADLREGGSIEQDADVVIGIMRPLMYARAKLQAARNEEQRHKAILEYDEAKDILEAAVLKNRGGRSTEYLKIFIKPEASVIRDCPPDTGDASLIDWAKLAEDMNK